MSDKYDVNPEDEKNIRVGLDGIRAAVGDAQPKKVEPKKVESREP